MANMTRYLRKATLDHVMGKIAFTMPAEIYLALFLGDPTDLGSQSLEVTGGSYARQAIEAIMSVTDLATGQATNSSEISFPVATADWGLITHVGLMDALTVGNMLYQGPADTARLLSSGSRYVLAQGQFILEHS